MKQLLWCALAAIAAGQPVDAANRPWQTLQMLNATVVLDRWRVPPSEYGPEPYYGMGGAMTIESARADLDRIKALGFRAVTVQWARGAPFDYMSDAHMAFFKRFVAEAKARDLRMWIVDDAGYPSGFAGGKISAAHPALRMQVLLPAQTWTVAGGETLDQSAPAGMIVATAIGAAGQTAPVPVVNGRLHWQAPAGQWTVTAVAHAYRTSPTRSDTNPTGAKDETQSLEDYLDPSATAQYLAETHEVYRRAVGAEFGKTILGFRGDEPDFSTKGLPWTEALFTRFRADKGYDVRPYLAAILTREAAGADPQTRAARADYYDVFSHLFAAGFFKPQADWCATNGLEYQVHLNHEERQIELAHSEGDFFRAFAPVQMPGIDAIWHQIWPDTVADFPRLAASAAHVYGHPRAFTESFAAHRPAPDLATGRYIIDEQFVRGINLIEMMYLPSSAMSHRPLAPFMADPAFPAWARYVSRMSYAMSQGAPAATVALLQPRAPLWLADRETDDRFVATERLLSERQVDFDIVDEDAVGSLLALDHRGFTTASGNSYRTVIVPRAEMLPRTVVARLHEFAAAGGKVLFLGGAPARLTGASYRESAPTEAADLAWAQVVPGALAPVPTPPEQPPAAAPAPQVVPVTMLQAVDAAVGKQDLRLSYADAGLRYIHRRLADATLFLLFNETAKRIVNVAVLSGRGGRVESWDARSGTARAVARVTHDSDGFHVPLDLAPHETMLLALR